MCSLLLRSMLFKLCWFILPWLLVLLVFAVAFSAIHMCMLLRLMLFKLCWFILCWLLLLLVLLVLLFAIASATALGAVAVALDLYQIFQTLILCPIIKKN